MLHAVPIPAHILERQCGCHVYHSLGEAASWGPAPEQLCAVLLLWDHASSCVGNSRGVLTAVSAGNWRIGGFVCHRQMY